MTRAKTKILQEPREKNVYCRARGCNAGCNIAGIRIMNHQLVVQSKNCSAFAAQFFSNKLKFSAAFFVVKETCFRSATVNAQIFVAANTGLARAK